MVPTGGKKANVNVTIIVTQFILKYIINNVINTKWINLKNAESLICQVNFNMHNLVGSLVVEN